MMTFLAIAARNERDHEEKEALLEEQIRLLCGYRDELEVESERMREQFTIAFRLHLQGADQDLRELLKSEAEMGAT